jgi:tetraacyldisaccharide 4'-kinase
MSIDQTYRDLVSGQWRGPVATTLRGGLTALEQPYRWAIAQRNVRFDHGHDVHRVEAPVISVGNLTVGGTGKSPFVAWLATWFQARGTPITIISRGYGSVGGEPNDEALELASRLPDVLHLQNRDRVAAAREALASRPQQVLILDDAFQHRRLGRDLDIVLLDALAPFGYGHLLPRGLLREPVEALARANVIALSRSDAVDAEERIAIRQRVQKIAPRALWLELVHKPKSLVAASQAKKPLAEIRDVPIAAFCGIGNPAGFRHTLETAGLTVAAWRELPDHCSYLPAVKQSLVDWLARQRVAHAVCTRKDLVKLRTDELAGKTLWALDIELEFAAGQAAFEDCLARLTAQFHSD